MLKILGAIVNTFLIMTFIAFCAFLATFFLAIFMKEDVALAIEFFKCFFNGS